MRFDIKNDFASLASCLREFLAIASHERWFKRVDELDRQRQSSAFLGKIIADYHWLEFALSHQNEVLSQEHRLGDEWADPLSLAALRFAQGFLKIREQLDETGHRLLDGRLRDALKSETGFAPLFHEIDFASGLVDHGYDVSFPDLCGQHGQCDLLFRGAASSFDVECKSISADAGRQIHRSVFYRFMHSIEDMIGHKKLHGQSLLVFVNLHSRLGPDAASQNALRNAIQSLLEDPSHSPVKSPHFTVERFNIHELFEPDALSNQDKLYRACKNRFGENIHVSGGIGGDFGCTVAMHSEREDDTSAPWLEAMRKAASQLTRTRPGFISIQFQEVDGPGLLSASLRRRAAILCAALFTHYEARHVNGVHICGFRSGILRKGQIGAPAFLILNPAPDIRLDFAREPFLRSLPFAEFTQHMRAPPLQP